MNDNVSSIDKAIESVIKSKLSKDVNLEKCYVNLSNDSIEGNYEDTNDDIIETKPKVDSTVLSNVRDPNHPIKCYVNKDNTISFINNTESPSSENGEIYYACLTSAANISQQDQILQLIPQNKIANYITSNKDYSTVQFLNAPQKSRSNQFINSDFSDSELISPITTKQNCTVCNVDFQSKRAYLKHMTIHDNDREFKCRWCKVSYNHDVNLLVHVAIIHPNQCSIDGDSDISFRCLVCQLKFARKKAFQGHSLIHQIDEELYCDQCTASFNSRVLLDSHKQDHHGITKKQSSLHCRICKEGFESVGHIKRHYRQFHKKTLTWPEDLNAKDVKTDVEGDQNFDPSNKRRRSSKVALQTIKLFAKSNEKDGEVPKKNLKESPKKNDESEENKDVPEKPSGNVRKRGRPRKICADPDFEKPPYVSDESTGEVRKRGRPRKSGPGAQNNICSRCFRQFKTNILLRRHEVTHTGIKEFKCPVCQKMFSQKSSVKIHMAVHEQSKSYQCNLCEKAFTYEHNMHTHIRSVHKVDPTSTDIDGGGDEHVRPKFTTSTPQKVTMSLTPVPEVVAPRKPARCMFCKGQKRRSCNLCRHVRRPAALRPFKCQLCYRSFMTEPVLAVHRRTHWPSKEHKCEPCQRSFCLPQTLKVHLLMDQGRPLRYRCNRCPKKFTDATVYVSHVTTDHPVPKATVTKIEHTASTAIIDPASMVSKTYVLEERSRVAAYRPFKCNLCSKSYKLRRYLRDHIKDHKTYSSRKNCTYCDKTFRTVRSLQQHARTQHIQRKIYGCSICPATFILKASMIRHGLVHTNSKPYACPICLRQFKSKMYCDRHINMGKCVKHNRNVPVDGDADVLGLADGTQAKLGPMCPYRLVEADHNAAQESANGFVDQYPEEKYMIVDNMDKDHGGQYYGDSGRRDAPGGYIYPTSALEPMGRRGDLVDKYPLLRATLLCDDDDDDDGFLCPRMVPLLPPDFTIGDTSAITGGETVGEAPLERLYHGCASCEFTFPDSQSLNEHVKDVHIVVKDFICSTCFKGFSVELSLWAHSKIHDPTPDDEGQHSCKACGQRFPSVPSLSRHVRMQHNDTLNYYRCTHCDGTYKTTRELDSHIKQINADFDALLINAEVINCDGGPFVETSARQRSEAYKRLPKEIKNPNKKREVMELPDSEIDKFASLDATTTTKASMQELIKAARHRRGLDQSTDDPMAPVAPVNRKYRCDICHKGFNRASNLQQHSSVHSMQTPFECNKCFRKFRHRCSLKTHEMTKHSGLTKLLRCHLCQKLLRSQVALRNHMRIHLATYPSACRRCQMMLTSADDERKHRRLGLCQVTLEVTVTATDEEEEEEMLAARKMEPTTTTMPSMSAADAGQSSQSPPRPRPSPGKDEQHMPGLTAAPSPSPSSSLSSSATNTVITCVTCAVGFTTLADYGRHICDRQKRKAHQCVLCDQNFVTSAELCQHIRDSHQQQTTFSCALCNLLFVHEALLINHRKTVHNL